MAMGSSAGAAEEAVEALTAAGEAVGLLKVRLYRPFPALHLVRALPPTVRSVAVLDRTKEPGATGEPLLLDVMASVYDAMDSDTPPFASTPHVIGGRYGLSSKESARPTSRPSSTSWQSSTTRRPYDPSGGSPSASATT